MVSSNDNVHSLKKRGLIKVVRNWRYFVSTIDGSEPTHELKPKLRFREKHPNTFGYKYDAKGMRTYLVKDVNKVITPEDAKIRSLYSRAQSTSIISPGEGFHPPTFSGLGIGESLARTGVLFDAEDTDMVHIKTIIAYDTGTVTAKHRQFLDVLSARFELDLLVETKRLFSNINEFIAYYKGVFFPSLNEGLAKLRWQCKPGAQVCIFSNTLPSRLIAQIRADDLKRHLSTNSDLKALHTPPENYTIPISFYTPENVFHKIRYYKPASQARDRKRGHAFRNGTKARAMALFLSLHSDYTNAPFDAFATNNITTNLYELLGIASDLTYTTAHHFFNKIQSILYGMDENNIQFKKADFWSRLFNCIPNSESLNVYKSVLRLFPEFKKQITSQYLQAEIERSLQTETHLTTQKKALFAQIIQSDFHENYEFLHLTLTLAVEKGNYEIVALIVDNSNIMQTGFINKFGGNVRYAYQAAKEYRHQAIDTLLTSKMQNPKSPLKDLDDLHNYGKYLQTLLSDIEKLLLSDASANTMLQVKFAIYKSQTSSLVACLSTNKNGINEQIREDITTKAKELLDMYQLVKAYSEHKINIKNLDNNANTVNTSSNTFIREHLQPIYKAKHAITFSKDVAPILMPMFKIMCISLVITAVFSTLIFAPVLAAGLAITWAVIAKAAVVFPLYFIAVSILSATNGTLPIKPTKNLLHKLSIFSSPSQSATKNLLTAIEKDVRADIRPPIAAIPPMDLAATSPAHKCRFL